MPTFSTTAATTCPNTIFSTWIRTATTATTTTTWYTWNTNTDSTSSTLELDIPYEEPQEVRNARRAAMEKEARVQRRARRMALALLLRYLSAAQREEYRQHRHFHVHGGATGRKYRIRHGRVANIDVLDAAGKPQYRLCAHPVDCLPDGDTMLAQALHLQSAANEEDFVKKANRHQ